MKLALLSLLLSFPLLAQNRIIGDLTPADQKYYKNEMGMGMNQLERIDSLVKEVNKLHGEVASLKAQMQELKAQIGEQKRPVK